MFEIFFHYFIFLFVIFSNGLFFSKIILKDEAINLNFFEKSIVGLIGTGFLAMFLNFFFPLNDYILYINIFIGIFFLIKFRKNLIFKYSKEIKIIIFFIFLLSLFNLYGSEFSDDLNHYHGGSIINTDNHNYIIGLNFLHHHYGYSSIWLILHSYLNFNNSFLQDIHILNAILFFLIVGYLLIESLNHTSKDKKNILFIISSIFVFFIIIKYTRLKEFGIDRPAVLLYCFAIYFTAKYSYFFEKTAKERNNFLLSILLICLFITSIKIVFISCFLIPTIFVINFKSYDFLIKKTSLLIYFFIFAYFFKNILISGCLIYPFEFTCFSSLAWNTKDVASWILPGSEAILKSFNEYQGTLSPSEYVKNFNWAETWFERNLGELNDYLFTILLAVFLFFLGTSSKKNQFKLGKFEFLIILLFILNLIFFIKTPVFRFHNMLIILFGLNILILIKKEFFKKKIVFTLIISLLLFFNFSKNAYRIYQGKFYNNPYEYVKNSHLYRIPIQKEIGDLIYYNGWIDGHPIGNMDLGKLKYKKKFWFDMIYK